MVFSVWSVPRCYTQDNWSNLLIVGQSPASKNVSMEAEGILGFCHQTMSSEDIAD
jgi:hypothetical protein